MHFIVYQIPRRVPRTNPPTRTSKFLKRLQTFTRIAVATDDASVVVASAAVAVAVVGSGINASVAVGGDEDVALRRSTNP